MAVAAKVRLVCCPKCENLLPELPDFSLHQCGGCGAVLKGVLEDGPTDISYAVTRWKIPEESNILELSQVEMRSAENSKAGILEEAREGVTCNSSFSKETQQSPYNLIQTAKQRNRNFDSMDNEYIPYSQGLVRNRNLPINHGPDVYGHEYVHFPDKHVSDHRPFMEPLRTRPVMDQWGVASRPGRGQMQFGDFRYFDEGQSSYETESYYGLGERIDGYHRPGPGRGPDRQGHIGDVENDRAELIRRLDELKDQISRSCDISVKSKEMIGNDQRAGPSTSSYPYGRRQSAYNYPENMNKQPVVPNDVGLPYFSDHHKYVPYMADRYGPSPLDPYPERMYPNEFMHYGANKPETFRQPPYGPHSQYVEHHPYHGSGYYVDVNNHNPFMPLLQENFSHQPTCSCMHCYEKSWPGPPKADHLGPHNPPFCNEPSNNPNRRPLGSNGSGDSNLRTLGSQKSLSVKSNDIDSENDGLKYHRPKKSVVGRKSRRARHPVAGGAPFIGCGNCFEVLKIPRKCVLLRESQQKLKCGACSSIIVFKLGDNGFIASASVHVNQLLTEMDEGMSGTLNENVRYPNDESNTYSNECDNIQDQFSPGNKKSKSPVSEKQLDGLSSASNLSEVGQTQENEVQALTEGKSSPYQDLPPNRNTEVVCFDQRYESQRPEQDKVSLERAASQQKSAKDVGAATEMDVSLNEFSNSCVSQDSVEISKEVEPKTDKGGDSFFVGLIKKSFKDFNKPNQSVEAGGPQVSVNGHFIPNHVVKRAEKLAGPIQPGEYWYDKRAGFWGVMGHPCLGIIMPNIEEFDYPLPSNCSAGITGVFVNGRELHQKDLNLLASRGLPITRNRSYLVAMTGSVVDEHTGAELDGLGKLAPTVERAKHGFGMKVPRFLARSKN